MIRETGHPTGFFTILDFIIRQFMQDFNALEGKSLAELREIGRALGVGNVMLKKKELLEQIRAVTLVAGQHSDTEPNAVPAEEPKRRGRRPRMSGVKVEGRSPAEGPEVPAETETTVAVGRGTAGRGGGRPQAQRP